VSFSLPRVKLIKSEELDSQFDENESICCITQNARGAFYFSSSIIFPEKTSLEIVKLLLSSKLDDDIIVGLRPEAMTEIGNVLLQKFIVLSSLATTLLTLLLRKNRPQNSQQRYEYSPFSLNVN